MIRCAEHYNYKRELKYYKHRQGLEIGSQVASANLDIRFCYLVGSSSILVFVRFCLRQAAKAPYGYEDIL